MTRPTFTPGRRVVVRAGAALGLNQSGLTARAPKGGKSFTVVAVQGDGVPLNVEGLDAHGDRMYFASEAAELAGPLP